MLPLFCPDTIIFITSAPTWKFILQSLNVRVKHEMSGQKSEVINSPFANQRISSRIHVWGGGGGGGGGVLQYQARQSGI